MTKNLPDGLIIVAKRDCPTCTLLEPVYSELQSRGLPLAFYSQDDPAFSPSVSVVNDDRGLETSFNLQIETVPTLIRIENGAETERAVGWVREDWARITGVEDLGADLPAFRPGCGSLSVEPGIAEELEARYGANTFHTRSVEVGAYDDEVEACYDRGWSDGLPVVPPTPRRVLEMLKGTTRDPQDVVGVIPPDLVECTVEKAAINAVLAGCKPEYLPIVLASVEAACEDAFCMHGLLATTWFSGPMVVVNGPIAKAVGMNSGGNALGQGNRANATIGRALQLIIRNVGGGRPQEVDRATLGQPGKYTFCFAEDESDDCWPPLSVERGFDPGASTVTLFAADGVQGVFDQLSRTPESLTNTFAACLRAVAHPKIAMASDAFLVVSPEHLRVYREAGWTKRKLYDELKARMFYPGAELVRGAGGIAEGVPEHFKDATIPKFRDGGLTIVRAGGKAGLFSAIIGGWLATGDMGSNPVTKEIKT